MITYVHKDILHLNEADFVAKGQRCVVYQHPQNADILVKVMNEKLTQRRSYKTLLAKFIPFIHQYRFSNSYLRELVENRRLQSKQQLSALCYIQKNIGFVKTNYGIGFMVKAERDQDGYYAQTLKALIFAKQVELPMKQKLHDFCDILAASDICVHDFRPHNMVYAHNQIQGDHFVLIDGIGEKSFIPWLKWSARLRKKSKLRNIHAFQKDIDTIFEGI